MSIYGWSIRPTWDKGVSMKFQFFGVRITIARENQTNWEPYLKSLGQWNIMLYKIQDYPINYKGYSKSELIKNIHILDNDKETL